MSSWEARHTVFHYPVLIACGNEVFAEGETKLRKGWKEAEG